MQFERPPLPQPWLTGVLIATFSLAMWGDACSEIHFRRILLTEEFQCEGADAGDIDGDGVLDVVAGPHWYPGPKFDRRYPYLPASQTERHAIRGYSDHFFSWCHDVNRDGRLDIVTVGMPGQPAWWHENPGGLSKSNADTTTWARHKCLHDVGGESPALTDFDGDGLVDLVCVHGGQFGFLTPGENPRSLWKFTAITPDKGRGVFTHGMGVGPMESEGENVLLETTGWWSKGANGAFQKHEVRFAESGGSQMFTYDFDGDGDIDVASVQNAHGRGLRWFERRESLWVPHDILPRDELSISQMHAMALADVDGDGIKDLVTGKRFWAHGGSDPGAQEASLLCWFRTVRTKAGVHFEPHLIDPRVGVGTQLVVKDINADGRADIVVGNKLGVHVLLQTERRAPAGQAPAHSPASHSLASHSLASHSFASLKPIGSDAFRNHVRESSPRKAADASHGFVLPPGFEIDLVASEPQIAKPLNMAFDDRGRLWVTSTVEYPNPAKPGERARDSIKVLEDTDGDGDYDRTTTFASNLNIPMGLYPVHNGVICFDIPNIVRLEDTDSDGVADKRTKLYGPFDTTRDTHGMCNAFTRGLDGWLYACHGFNNQSRVAGADGSEIEMKSGNVFRMRLDGSRIEHFGHGQVNPFGLAIDQFGDVYTADCHTKPVNWVIRGGYHDSFGAPHDGIGYVPNVLEHLHGSTGIGGIVLGESLRFPKHYRQSTFGGNVVTGRVNRNTLQRDSEQIRAIEEPDFLVTNDPWFRPVDLQAGPDGALYIADFYNRIIGHYEVKLDHPGRDRHRGRIWRVRYTGKPSLADSADEALPALDAAQLAARLGAAKPDMRDRIVNHILDQRSAEDVRAVVEKLAPTTNSNAAQQIARLWLQFRTGTLHKEELALTFRSPLASVRAQAFRILPEVDDAAQIDAWKASDWVQSGMQDTSPIVRRAAAAAAVAHPSVSAATTALARLASGVGTHERHLLKMAVRNQLKADKRWTWATEANAKAELLEIVRAVPSERAGDYVVQHLDVLESRSAESLRDYATFAARHASNDSAENLAAWIQRTMADDLPSQIALLESVDDGMLRRGKRLDVVRQWAVRLAKQCLEGATQKAAPVRWSESQTDGAACWVESTRRASADGRKNTRLLSSFPNGEQRVGVYRSSPFELGPALSFYVAGHDGFPDKPLGNNNYVALRLASSRETLHRAAAPRNDVAQHVQWDTSAHRGQLAFLELVDRDKAGAYAWLAVGRFSESRLNPSQAAQRWKMASTLIRRFQLHELRGIVAEQLERHPMDSVAAGALASLQSTQLTAALCSSLSLNGWTKLQRDRVVLAVIKDDAQQAAKLLQIAIQLASPAQQRTLIGQLAGDRPGGRLLVEFASAGRVNLQLLAEPSIRQRLEAAIAPVDQQALQRMLADIPAEPPQLAELMNRRVQQFGTSAPSVSRGAMVFTKQCALCHQVAGKGKKVGPNLDGIGTRGLERLVEDVLAPSRNVDAAFRATTIRTDDGEVLVGAVRADDGGELLVLVNEKGEEVRLPKNTIERQQQSRLSPMPANFSTKLDIRDFNDLIAYLLSLR